MAEKPTYSIRDWVVHFENHESRKVRATRWVPIPNKHDGKGFKRVTRHPRAVEAFCAWNLIIEVASKMPERGILVDEDGPLDANDLADMTSFPPEIFEAAFEVMTQPGIDWLICTSDNGSQPELVQTALPVVSRDEIPASPGPSRNAGTEGKGKEGKGREGNAPALPPPPFTSEAFITEWTDYIAHRKQMRKALTKIACGRLFKQFEQMGEVRATAALTYSMADGRTWQGVFEPPGAGAPQATMFTDEEESTEMRELRENCTRCNGTGTELVPGKGARPCDHLSLEDQEP